MLTVCALFGGFTTYLPKFVLESILTNLMQYGADVEEILRKLPGQRLTKDIIFAAIGRELFLQCALRFVLEHEERNVWQCWD